MILRYAITDPAYYGSDPSTLKSTVEHTLSNLKVDLICLRDKKTTEYKVLAEAFMGLKPIFPKTLFFLLGDIDAAVELGADGIHLPSGMFEQIGRSCDAGLKVIVSTHSFEEIKRAEGEGAYGVTYGPIFETPGKGPPKGLEKLKEIRGKISLNIFALGGIVSDEQIEAVERAGTDGFASIRYFVER